MFIGSPTFHLFTSTFLTAVLAPCFATPLYTPDPALYVKFAPLPIGTIPVAAITQFSNVGFVT